MGRPRQRPSSPGSAVKVATGPSVLRGNVRAAADLSKTLRSTLGPLGMEKMIVSKRTRRAIVTDDGALILRAANIRHAAAKIVAGLGDAQASECGDGVAASVLLVGAPPPPGGGGACGGLGFPGRAAPRGGGGPRFPRGLRDLRRGRISDRLGSR